MTFLLLSHETIKNMLHNLIGLSIISFICALSVTELSAQIKNQEKTEKTISKVVIVEKIIGDDGTETSTKKVLEGKEAEDYFKNQANIEAMEIEVDVQEHLNGDQVLKTEKKKYTIISTSKNGEEEKIVWDGTGEMPNRMKDLLGEELRHSKASKTKNSTIIKNDKNSASETQVVDLDSNSIPEELRKILEKEGIDPSGLIEIDGPDQVENIKKNKPTDKPKAKAQLGVAIAKTMLGAQVTMVQPGSAADNAGMSVGDNITHVEGIKITSPASLIQAIANYIPGDMIAVTYLRNNEKKTSQVKLKAPNDPFPYKTWKQVMNLNKE